MTDKEQQAVNDIPVFDRQRCAQETDLLIASCYAMSERKFDEILSIVGMNYVCESYEDNTIWHKMVELAYEPDGDLKLADFAGEMKDCPLKQRLNDILAEQWGMGEVVYLRVVRHTAAKLRENADKRLQIQKLLDAVGQIKNDPDANIASVMAGAEVISDTGGLQMIGWEDLLKMEFPPAEILLEPWFESEQCSVLFADANVGKSWLAMAMGVAVACGVKAVNQWQAPKPRKVLFIDGEGRLQKVMNRLDKLLKMQGGDEELFKRNFRMINVKSQRTRYGFPIIVDLLDKNTQAKIRRMAMGFELVILDNLQVLFPMEDENSPKEFVKSLNPFVTSLQQQGCAVLILHHTRKTKPGEKPEFRGSGALKGIVDNMFYLQTPKSPYANVLDFEVHFDKVKDSVKPEPFRVYEEIIDDHGNTSWAVETKSQQKRVLLDEIRQMLKDGIPAKEIAKMPEYEGMRSKIYSESRKILSTNEKSKDK